MPVVFTAWTWQESVWVCQPLPSYLSGGPPASFILPLYFSLSLYIYEALRVRVLYFSPYEAGLASGVLANQ